MFVSERLAPLSAQVTMDGRTVGLEGMVSKRLGSRYRSGRSPDGLADAQLGWERRRRMRAAEDGPFA